MCFSAPDALVLEQHGQPALRKGPHVTSQDARIAQLEARLDAMSSTIKSVLTTLVLRGLLTRPAVEQILKESEEALANAPAAKQEINSVREDLPGYIQKAIGPQGEDDDESGGH